MFALNGDEILARAERRIKNGLERVIEDDVDFAFRRCQLVKNAKVS